MMKEKKAFQAETKELLDLMIHSLYSHREIFLRELISNASDAIEKLKFESLTNSNLIPPGTEFEIRLDSDKNSKTLSISDNGIGMTYDEVVNHIGTIAHSGTKAFLKMQQDAKSNPELIGQFGVGFYSAFMVADRVTLHTHKAGSNEGVFWESEGTGTYTVEKKPRENGHGTTITLHLKSFQEDEEVQDFTDSWVLKNLVKKYSDFVATPIRMKTSREKAVEGKSETVIEDETLNSQKALWLRSPSEISQDEYNEFYKHISHDWSAPLKTIHYKAEGTMEFVSVLFMPAQKPFDYDYRDRKVGLSLYVKRVLIKNDCEELIPPYLRFVKGLVDSDDLALNVSRELLQQDRQIARIKKAITNKVLSSLKELMEQDKKSYENFWANFGATLKEGVAFEPNSIDKLQDLLLFHSTQGEELTSLRDYVTRMKPEQKAIYYITGDSLTQIRNSPYLEKLRSKGFEVLLMTDKVDAWVVSGLRTYSEKELQSITSANLDLESDEEKKKEELNLKESESKLKNVLDVMKEALKDQVQDIKLSTRLTESPVCLVSSSDSASAHMERILASMGQDVPKGKRILEINPSHPVYEAMLKASKSRQEEWSEILYQQALLNEGSPIQNPLKYSQQIAKLMVDARKD